MIKDKLVLGMILGAVANLVKCLLSIFLFFSGALDCLFCHMAAGMFFRDISLSSFPFAALLVGFCADFILGAFLGVFFIYLLHFTGPRFFLSKGFGYGGAVWFLFTGGLMSLGITSIMESHPWHSLILLLLHILYGMLLGILAQKYGAQAFLENP
ncbi:MAG: hypothetical protein ACM3WV_11540 [Bacillota bacterium]